MAKRKSNVSMDFLRHKEIKIVNSKGQEQKYVLIFKPKSEEDRNKLRKKQERDINLDLIDQDFLFFVYWNH